MEVPCISRYENCILGTSDSRGSSALNFQSGSSLQKAGQGKNVRFLPRGDILLDLTGTFVFAGKFEKKENTWGKDMYYYCGYSWNSAL